MKIRNGNILLRNSVIKNGSLDIESGRISRINRSQAHCRKDDIDAKGCFVSPGFIDTHIHGDPRLVLKYHAKHGTTAIVSAISCASRKSIKRSLGIIRRYCSAGEIRGSVLGARLEGPFINKTKAGAQNKTFITSPSEAVLRRIIKESGGLLKIITIAPELDGSERLIKILKKSGIIASIGHTDAGYKEAVKGIRCGITHATHLPNGMRRSPDGDSAVNACLGDKRVTVEMIFDLVHVPATLLRKFLKIKARPSIISITDSVRAEMGGRRARKCVYRLKDGTIAGSDLTMIDAVKNAVRRCGVDLKDAIAFATINPAKLLGVDRNKGSISKGKDADLVIFDKNFDVKMTMVRGRIVFRKRGF